MNYLDANTQCESDGAYLAIPQSDAENAFLASLIPNDNIWIGVNDIDEEGTFAAVDDQDVTYTKWYANRPDNNGNADGVFIRSNGFWDNVGITAQYKFICMFNVEFDFSGKFLYILNQSYTILFIRLIE